MRAVLIVSMLLFAGTAFAQQPVTKLFLGANAISFDGATAFPSDFELGVAGRASLSAHLSAVGSAWYGVSHTYLRGSAGARITATDVNDPNFSMGIGLQYQATNDETVRSNEWAPDVVLGWKPYPQTMPKVIIGAGGGYGLTTKQAFIFGAVRYELGGI